MVPLYLENLSKALRPWADSLGALVFPSSCYLCSQLLDKPLAGPVCPSCVETLGEGSGICKHCGVILTNPHRCRPRLSRRWSFEQIHSLGPYEGPLEKMVVGLKYLDKPRLAEPLAKRLGGLLLSQTSQTPLDVDVIVPVPLSGRRRRQRGYNQSELLARALSRVLRKPHRPRWLRRIRHTPPQTSLSASMRRKNLAGAFRAQLPPASELSRVLLVDDVFTTGSTLDACSRCLLAAGASSVEVVTVARVA